MKHFGKIAKRIAQLILVLLVCLIVGPELFIFLPEIVFYLDIAGLEFIITSLLMFLKPVRNRIAALVSIICENKFLKKHGMLIVFILVAPTMPELFEFIEAIGICLLLTCILVSFKENLGYLVPRIRIP